MTRRILLTGSTGLVGGLVGARLVGRPEVDLIRLIRNAASGAGHIIDYERLCQEPERTLGTVAPDGVDIAISCLGTTIATAGSQAAMFRVDHDYVLAVAKAAKALGAQQFILMTAAGAGGPGFYLQSKGRIEQAVTALGFRRVDIIRPGFLLGSRSERRVWEAIGQRIFSLLTPILVGPLSRYGAIPAETVAEAMVMLTTQVAPGSNIHDNNDLRRLAAHPRRS